MTKPTLHRFRCRISLCCAVLIGSCIPIVVMSQVASAQTSVQASATVPTQRDLKVGVAGSPPFVVDVATGEGISIEIWQKVAASLGWRYDLVSFRDVPHALQALQDGAIDAVAGPVSITSMRAEQVRFTQPYYESSLSILSRSEPSGWAERIRPFFSGRFFIALGVFLLILCGVGTLLWIAERKRNVEQFPAEPASGIANGMWCAIVTMSTTGYGDRAPVTFWGRIVMSVWIVISLIGATTMIAGIASTLTLTGMNTVVISKASALAGRNVGVVPASPAASFVTRYGANSVAIESPREGYELLKARKVDAVVYDRPQLLYFLQQHPDENVAISTAEYQPQGYGFALRLNTTALHRLNVALLSVEESGSVTRILDGWLGAADE